MGQDKKRQFLSVIVTIALISNGLFLVDGKRTFGKNRSSSSSSSSSSRRVTSNYGSVTKPSYSGSNSHSDLAKLSYSNYNSQPNRPSSVASASAPKAGAAAPIGWNVPNNKPQGPPPAYSPTGGGHSNLHEAPPAYKPSNAAPPSYSAATGTHTGTAFGAGHGATNYGAATAHHTPIQPSNAQSVHSSYPKQEYHPAGGMPSYHAPPPNYQQSYHPSYSGVPMSGAALPPGGVVLPPGAVLLPAGAALPAHATYISQPSSQSSSSGPGFGTGLIAGGLAGGLLTHAFSSSGSRDYAPQAAPAAAGNGDGKVIIINNGPPGSVTTGSDGTTVINAGGAQQQPAPPQYAPAPAPAAAPESASMPLPAGAAAAATVAGGAAVVAAASNTSDAVAPPSAEVVPPAAAPGAAPTDPNAPPAGGQIVCMPIMVNVTSPTDPTQMVEVQQIACFNAPPPAADGTTTAPVATETAKSQEQSQQNSAINAAPPATPKTSEAMLPENSKIHAASGGQSISFVSFMASTILSMCVAYCMH